MRPQSIRARVTLIAGVLSCVVLCLLGVGASMLIRGSVEDGRSYVFCGKSRSDTKFISIHRHHQVVADHSREDVWALARKRAEWGLTVVCMLAYTVYSFLLSYAVPARFVNKICFSLSLPAVASRASRADALGQFRTLPRQSCAFAT